MSLSDYPRMAPAGEDVTQRMIRPLATGLITGLARTRDGVLLVLDARSGRVGRVDPATDDLVVVNEGHCPQFVGARGLVVAEGRMWSATASGVARWPLDSDGRVTGPGDMALAGTGIQSVSIYDDLIYTVHARSAGGSAHIMVHDQHGNLRSTWAAHGIGMKSVCATAEHLWLVDEAEQTAYCLDRRSGVERFRAVTPQERPTAILVDSDPMPDTERPSDVLGAALVAYYSDEPYIADDPWSEPNWVVRYRDRALVAPLHFWHDSARARAYSTGYRVAVEYFVELRPDDAVYPELTWRIGLPLETDRQHVVSVMPVGQPFTVVNVAEQPMAQFELGTVDGSSRRLVGWRAELEVFGVKHLINSANCPDEPLPDGFAAKYLVDDYDLAMAAPSVIAAASQAAAGATDPITLAHNIRNWVYDHVDYEMGNADDPETVLGRGTGSCGEYVGVLMALTRLSGLASRAAGRYKVPYAPWTRGEPLYPDFNHAWLDLFVPGVGWLPIESNPDDTDDGGPYPDRFFLGLPWRHIELTKDVSFESVTYTRVSGNGEPGRRRRGSAGRLSRNHIRFQVLAELAPVPALSAAQPANQPSASAHR